MTFRLNEFRAKIQFTTSAAMPNLIYRACLATGVVSNTVYCQHAIAEALSRDLGIPLQDILDDLPPPRGPAGHVYNPEEGTMRRGSPIHKDPTGGTVRIGPANTDETVR